MARAAFAHLVVQLCWTLKVDAVEDLRRDQRNTRVRYNTHTHQSINNRPINSVEMELAQGLRPDITVKIVTAPTEKGGRGTTVLETANAGEITDG